LRPDNILVDLNSNILKIADFHPGKTFTITHSHRENTENVLGIKYTPPEILIGATYSTKSDMWNVGCIFAELLRTRKLFGVPVDVNTKAEQLDIIFLYLGTPTEEEWPGVTQLISKYKFKKHKPFTETENNPAAGKYGYDLLMKMLCYDPLRRISAKEALNHPYFNNIDKSKFN